MRTFIIKLTNWMSVFAGIVVIAMIFITFADIVMRLMGKPIPGVYEVIAFLGIAVAGFALPRSSLMGAHVGVDILTEKLSGKPRLILKIFTRVVVSLFFLISAWYFLGMAQKFISTRAVTMTLRVPFYPVVIGMAFCCLVQCIVSIYQIFEKEGGHNG